ncbi:hypothetical protein ACJX0J_017461, partial [Zea mays]
YGPAGYALFVLVYAGLEVLAIPAIPLTMSAGLLFGSVTGTIIVSISGTLAAAVAFLIARYFARERILKLVEGNKKFLAIDKAIGENGFKVVTLLRLSPLLPFSLGNYLYGLTSVKFLPYVLGSWLGMLPGSWAYVSAGAFGRAIIQEESEIGWGGNGQLWTLSSLVNTDCSLALFQDAYTSTSYITGTFGAIKSNRNSEQFSDQITEKKQNIIDIEDSTNNWKSLSMFPSFPILPAETPDLAYASFV